MGVLICWNRKGFGADMNAVRTSLIFLLLFAAAIAASASPGEFNYTLKPEIEAALTSKDTAKVLALIDQEIAVDPNYAPHYFLKGLIAFERAHYDQALEQMESTISRRPKVEEALYYKGMVLLKQGQLDQADKIFSDGLKKSKNAKALFHNGMGLLLLQKQEYSNADVEFRKAISVGPDRAEFHANLGDANYFAQIYPLAISEYNQVITMDTTFLDVYFRLARAYVAQGQYNGALDQLRIVLTRDSLYTNAWKEIGRLYTMAGLSADDRDTKEQRFKEAIGSYRKFLELAKDSSDGEAFFNLGRAYFNLGGFPEANMAFEHVLKLGDEPKNIYMYLGRGYIAVERYQDGIDMLKRQFASLQAQDPAWKPGPGEADVYRRLAEGYKALQDWPNAAENFKAAYELDTSDARAAIDAAVAYHQLKDFPAALGFYEKRIALGSDSWSVFLNAAYCTLNLQDYEKSVQYLLKVVALDSTNEKAHSLLSNTYLIQLQDCDNGVLWTQKWLAMDTTNCEALKSLGYAYFANICQANYLKAIGFFERALSCYRAKGAEGCGNSDIMLYIAQANHLHAAALLDNNQKQESKTYFKAAFDWYNKVLKCDPGNADAKKGVLDTKFEF